MAVQPRGGGTAHNCNHTDSGPAHRGDGPGEGRAGTASARRVRACARDEAGRGDRPRRTLHAHGRPHAGPHHRVLLHGLRHADRGVWPPEEAEHHPEGERHGVGRCGGDRPHQHQRDRHTRQGRRGGEHRHEARGGEAHDRLRPLAPGPGARTHGGEHRRTGLTSADSHPWQLVAAQGQRHQRAPLRAGRQGHQRRRVLQPQPHRHQEHQGAQECGCLCPLRREGGQRRAGDILTAWL